MPSAALRQEVISIYKGTEYRANISPLLSIVSPKPPISALQLFCSSFNFLHTNSLRAYFPSLSPHTYRLTCSFSQNSSIWVAHTLSGTLISVHDCTRHLWPMHPWTTSLRYGRGLNEQILLGKVCVLLPLGMSEGSVTFGLNFC